MVGIGLRDWVTQRVSAVVMVVYFAFLFAFFLAHPHVSFVEWKALFSSTWMRVATLVVMLGLVAHTWIGLWTVSTDYIKGPWLRLAFQTLVILLLVGYFVWLVDSLI